MAKRSVDSEKETSELGIMAEMGIRQLSERWNNGLIETRRNGDSVEDVEHE